MSAPLDDIASYSAFVYALRERHPTRTRRSDSAAGYFEQEVTKVTEAYNLCSLCSLL